MPIDRSDYWNGQTQYSNSSFVNDASYTVNTAYSKIKLYGSIAITLKQFHTAQKQEPRLELRTYGPRQLVYFN